MDLSERKHVLDDSSGLTDRARRFVQQHGVHVPGWMIEQHRLHWARAGRPPVAVDQLLWFQARWGGLVLPPAPGYDGGPLTLDGDDPDVNAHGILVTVGNPRSALPYGFGINAQGHFGICGMDTWVGLHASVEGWVESLALAYAARDNAGRVRRVTGPAVRTLTEAMTALTPLPEVAGLADSWWRSADALVAVQRGEAELFDTDRHLVGYVFEDLNWANI
ncbi:hypothetical protein [Micromonospora zhanjiangensis]|uniref:SUKH-4 immunity protein n=1 Tax=Micromonospora zhanjiangensis TaxID=1522057 RepID=A0ABV8KMH5_9ACTN